MFPHTKDEFLPYFSNITPSRETEGDSDQEVATEQELPAKVILFNDEVHTFEEVIFQIIKATGCDKTRAEEMTWEVHHTGKSVVYQGEVTKCVTVSAVLEEIALMTQIEI